MVLAAALSACGTGADNAVKPAAPQPSTAEIKAEPTVAAAPEPPDLQAELLSDRNTTTTSPLGTFDFKNHTYELPRGWQNPDGTAELTLVDGKVAPVEATTRDDMDPAEKAAVKAERRIGMSYVATKYFDLTGDGVDEALVVLKIETAGSAIPQVVYVFTWKDGKPELIWPFRTGDRSDGGLKNLYPENGELVVELFGKDRFLLGQTETGKITGDEEQLCCPTHFTRTRYKWNGKNFLMQGKRLTFSIEDPNAPPLENFGEIMNDPVKSKKYLANHP
ncbi:MAG: hypothetical protein UZ17_ACD001000137 [Acidobacteria bacterium OLB17]|nr:MAG: hypothetical protein UZ17_ACD001000137 [Acidobacteria bacterium OLB17]MCZ2391002.1 hypothetical protein [Acidobacteriota bacterium]